VAEEVTQRWEWDSDIGNYCAMEELENGWVRKEPLEVLTVSEKVLLWTVNAAIECAVM